jgi:cellulose synthase (UDP-forming)
MDILLKSYKKIVYLPAIAKKKFISVFIFYSVIILLAILFFLLIFSMITVIQENNVSIPGKVISLIVLCSISFWCVHCIGFIDNFFKSLLRYDDFIRDFKVSKDPVQPKIAIFIPIFNEDAELIENTILAIRNLNYKNYTVYLLDDSSETKKCKAIEQLAYRFNLEYVHRKERRGYKAGAINDAINNLKGDTKYLLLLDSDHRVKPEFLDTVIPFFEGDNSLSVVQMPQYFTNQTKNRLARAYSFQQRIFNKHVCRGLCVNNSAFICGTNVIFRLEDLKEIGGLSEWCITEDIATSFVFHQKKYKFLFLDEIHSEGLAPFTLSAYFAQQQRWAYGTIQNFKLMLTSFFKNPLGLQPVQWWEFIVLNGTWYFLGWSLLIWLLYPVVVILFKLETVFFELINIFFLFFIIMLGIQFITGMKECNYRFRDLVFAQGLFISIFPVFIEASMKAVFEKKLIFQVTPKKRDGSTSIKQILPHILLLGLLVISIVTGIWNTINTGISYSYASVILWAGYDTLMLVFVIVLFLDERRLEV